MTPHSPLPQGKGIFRAVYLPVAVVEPGSRVAAVCRPIRYFLRVEIISTVRIIASKARHSSVSFWPRARSLTPVIIMKRYTHMLGRGRIFLHGERP
jgi:hypothetical protein